MKNLDDIWQEYIEQDFLNKQTLNDLIWHLENDPDPIEVIILTTDMGLTQVAPYIAKHLDHENSWVREIAVSSLLGRLQLPEYAEKGFKMAQEDPVNNVRSLAIFSIGAVLNEIQNKELKNKIAQYLYFLLNSSDEEDDSFKGEAYESALAAIGVPPTERPSARDLENVDIEVIEKFREKYGL